MMNIEQERLEVAQVEIDVIRKDIKNMYLSVYPPTGRVQLSVPRQTDRTVLHLFALSKISWIRKQMTILKNQERETTRLFITGESHYFEGKRYLLKVVEQKTGKSRVEIKNLKWLYLYVRKGASREHKARVMREWYRSELKRVVPSLLEKWEKKIGVHVHDWRIKSMKTKWGSCNIAQKRIWLNLELAKKPSPHLEYILVHELIHLLERTHNENFVYYMNKYLPKWRSYQQALNQLPLTELLEEE